MKKLLCLTLVLVAVLGVSVPALAGKIVTPNGGRAILWKGAYSSGDDYVAYVSSGNSATLLQQSAVNSRKNVNAYGYNSKEEYDYYKGWVNQSYYVD